MLPGQSYQLQQEGQHATTANPFLMVSNHGRDIETLPPSGDVAAARLAVGLSLSNFGHASDEGCCASALPADHLSGGCVASTCGQASASVDGWRDGADVLRSCSATVSQPKQTLPRSPAGRQVPFSQTTVPCWLRLCGQVGQAVFNATCGAPSLWPMSGASEARNVLTRPSKLPSVVPSPAPNKTPASSPRSLKIGPPESPCRACTSSSTSSCGSSSRGA